MFDNVGRGIKNWAVFFYVLEVIGAVLSGVLYFIGNLESGTPGLTIIVSALIIVIGCIFARLSVIMMYGFGELVECAGLINDNVYLLTSWKKEEKCQSDVAKVPTWKRLQQEKMLTERKEEKKQQPEYTNIPTWKRIQQEKELAEQKGKSVNADTWECSSCKNVNAGNHRFCQYCGSPKG